MRVLMGIAKGLFKAETACYLLGIRGYEYNEFEERLSSRARENLDAAIEFLEGVAAAGWCFDDDQVQRPRGQ